MVRLERSGTFDTADRKGLLNLFEQDLLSGLKAGVERSRRFMEELTEYHGGPVATEYLITTDIAREFLERGHHVQVEALNRHFCSLLTADNARLARVALGSKRTDVAIGDSLTPDAIVEVKIRISTLAGLVDDLDKLSSTIRFMKATRQKKILAACVFQTHIAATKVRWRLEDFIAASQQLEEGLRTELFTYAQQWPDFTFEMRDLQDRPADGIVNHGVECNDDGSEEMGADGHATRYHAVLVKHLLHEQTAAAQDTRP